MKNKKIKSILEQSIFILGINLLLIYDGVLSFKNWSVMLTIAFSLFHAGTFLSLYHTILSKNYTQQKDELIFHYNFSVYLLMMCLFLLNRFMIAGNHLIWNYFLTLFFLFLLAGFIYNTRSSYVAYKKSIINL